MYKSCLCLALIAICFSVGCGSGGSSSGGGNHSDPPIVPVNIQGQYQIVASSNSAPNSIVLIETNFTQTGTDVFASQNNVVMIQGALNNNMIQLLGLGGQCDQGTIGDDTIQGTFSTQTQASMSFIEAGSLGTVTATGNVTFSPDGSQIVGTYSIPAACGLSADTGLISGEQVKPFAGSYAGVLDNYESTDTIIAVVSQSGLTLNVTGTDNGTPFTLTGTAVGATFNIAGTIAGQAVQDVGIYDSQNNSFVVFDSQFNYLGTLNAGTNPQSVSRSTGFLKAVKR